MTIKILRLVLIASLASIGVAHAQQPERENRLVVMVDGLIKPDDKHLPLLDKGYGLDLRYNGFKDGKPLGYEVHLSYGKLKPKNASDPTGNRSSLGLQGVYRFQGVPLVTPYALLGVGIAYNDELPTADPYGPMVNAGAGLASGPLMNFMGRPLRVRVEGQYSYEDYGDTHYSTISKDRANYHDVHAYVGLEWTLTRPTEQPSNIQVVPPAPAPDANPSPPPASETPAPTEPAPAPTEPAPTEPAPAPSP